MFAIVYGGCKGACVPLQLWRELTFLPMFIKDDLLLQCRPLLPWSTSLEIHMKNLLEYSEAVPVWSNEGNNRLVSRLPASGTGLQMGVFLFTNTGPPE